MRLWSLRVGLCLFVASIPAYASTYTSFLVPGSQLTRAEDINNKGHIVGSFNGRGPGSPPEPEPNVHGFLWAEGVFKTIDVPGSSSTILNGISDNDAIAALTSPRK